VQDAAKLGRATTTGNRVHAIGGTSEVPKLRLGRDRSEQGKRKREE